MEVRHLGSFCARSASGKTYRIDVFQEFKHVDTREARHVVPGMKSLRTEDGLAVNRIDKGRYSVLEFAGSVEVVSDDPNAP